MTKIAEKIAKRIEKKAGCKVRLSKDFHPEFDPFPMVNVHICRSAEELLALMEQQLTTITEDEGRSNDK